MCGIAGILSSNTSLVTVSRLQQMTKALIHRGPQGERHWLNPAGTAGFGHRRLAIIDLQETGAQPMHYGQRYTIIHNGELYNYRELKETLQKKGYRFTTNSDTEVILAAYDHYQAQCLQYFDGMFAFAIWDDQQQQLFAARDYLGEKPFYYYYDNEQLVFASELKGLWAAGIERTMDETMLFNYFTLGYTQHPHNSAATFYKNIQQLPAASFLVYKPGQTPAITSYWQVAHNYTNNNISEEAAIEQFGQLFSQSISRRLRSDVPIGTSLSGGLDSSSIAAVIAGEHTANFATFSATFPGFEKDEARHIQQVTAAYSLSNYTVQPTGDDFIAYFEKLCYHQEEPFQSASLLVQFMVYALAKERGVTVVLDGQGADELLAGYHKYYPWYWQELARHNSQQLQTELQAARQAGITAPWSWSQRLAAWWPAGAAAWQTQQRRRAQKKLPDLSPAFVQAYGHSHYHIPLPGRLNNVLHYNTFINGLNELLRYADRNAMAHGLEVRLPFLSHELVRFIFSLPAHYKIRNGQTKWLLRKSMAGKLPPAIIERTDKIGFEPPQKQWFGQPLVQEYVYESKRKLVKQGILQENALQKKIQPHDAHAAENYDWRYLVAGALL